MPPKKAAKKAKKKPASDARKAFEHLGRVQSLASFARVEEATLHTLLSSADAAYQAEHFAESAHLLRATEHLLFAAVVETNVAQVSRPLLKAVEEEINHLTERAEEHGHCKEAPQAVQRIYAGMRAGADSAMRRREYRKALELARGAEALSHIGELHHLLPEPRKVKALA